MFVLVVAKEPVPGRAKTRLCPPCTPDEAAAVAEAALHDTMDAATRSGADQVLVALDGAPGEWLPTGVRVIAQVEGSFQRRLAAAWCSAGGPGVQIGMDTPQVAPELLDDAMARLERPDTDAVLGPAADGGWWALGLRAADERVFDGVLMSRPDTGRHQRDRLRSLGLRVHDIATLRDVDRFEDATAVAAQAPGTRFAETVHRVAQRHRARRAR